ncbi:MAG: glycoside hydrolase family 6 protein [Solirubrobacteraceae bacterium]
MSRFSRLLPLLFSTLVLLASPAAAGAASFDPLGFHLLSPVLYVHENAGQAAITVVRGNVTADAQIHYIAVGPGHRCGNVPCTAQYDWDFKFVQGTLDFPPFVAAETFNVPILDHHVPVLPQTLQVSLYGGALAAPTSAVLTILGDDPFGSALAPVVVRPGGESNGGSAGSAGVGDPLAGQRFFVDPERDLALAARAHPALRLAAAQPWVERFGAFSGADVGLSVSHYLARTQAQEPGSTPMLSTYRLVDGHCGHWSDPAAEQLAYHNFIERFAQGIGGYHAVLFLEMDSLITTPCLSPHGLAVRMHELSDAIDVLTAHCPQLVIYLDAGAADALPAWRAASLLRRAGVAKIEGFFLNSTHFDWTAREIAYGQVISRMTGGKHFVINTSENGRGPLAPPNRVTQGNEVLCNPLGRGLGPLPTWHTGYPHLDAFAWILHPGESTGRCGAGAPATGDFWLTYALMLARNANFRVH